MNRISTPCVKEWGPKTIARSALGKRLSMYATTPDEAPLPPSRAITVYDSAIELHEVQLLQIAYSRTFKHYRYVNRLMELFTKLAFVYGPSISHPSLRYAVCAYISSWSDIPTIPVSMEYSQRAVQALRRRLNEPTSVDEGDLFAVSLLATWTNKE